MLRVISVVASSRAHRADIRQFEPGIVCYMLGERPTMVLQSISSERLAEDPPINADHKALLTSSLQKVAR